MIINWCGWCGVELKSNAGYCPDCERERRKLSKEVKEESLKNPVPKFEIPENISRKFSGRKK